MKNISNVQRMKRDELLAALGEFSLSLASEKDKMNVMAAANLVTDLYKKDADADHMLRVAVLSIKLGRKDADEIVSALLHSCLQDKTMDMTVLQQMFGMSVLMKVGMLDAFAREFAKNYGMGIAMFLSPSSRDVSKIIIADFYDNAFMLRECKDWEGKGAQYEPVFRTLISAIKANKIRLNPVLIPEILEGLEEGLKSSLPF